MTLNEIKSVFSLVRESEVEDRKRENPYFRLLQKPDASFMPGFFLAYDPEMLTDLYPSVMDMSERTLEQMEKLYMANPEAFTKTVFKVTSAEIYGTVRNQYATDAEVIAAFGGEEIPSLPKMEAEPPKPQPQPPKPQAQVQTIQTVPEPTQVDYSILRSIVKEVVDARQGEILEAVRAIAQRSDSEALVGFTSSVGELIKSVNQISNYINTSDMKVSEDRQSVRQLLTAVQDTMVKQEQSFSRVGEATALLREQSIVFEDVISRYSGVELLTDEAEFNMALVNLDRINSPGSFMLAFKEALKMLWYSGDRQAAEKVLIATVNVLKEGV